MPLIEEIFSDDEETKCDVKKSGTQKLEAVSSDDISCNDPTDKMVTSPDNSKTDSPRLDEGNDRDSNTKESVTTDRNEKQVGDASKKMKETGEQN